MTADRLFDPGLQPERTLLAWRRTALALAVVGLVGARLLLDDLGAVAILLGVIGAASAGIAYLAASARYRAMHRMLTKDAVLRTGAMPVAVLAVAALVIGVGAVAAVVVSATT